jgi:hypothetical protein
MADSLLPPPKPEGENTAGVIGAALTGLSKSIGADRPKAKPYEPSDYSIPRAERAVGE